MIAMTEPRDVALTSNGTLKLAEPVTITPQSIGASASPYRSATFRPEKNILEAAAKAGWFTTLGDAIRTAGLVELLSGPGPFTLFAPTDAAFAKLPKADLDALLADIPRLTHLLTYHVVTEIVIAPKAGSPRLAGTVNGTGLKITAKNRGFRVNEAAVENPEIIASNGVIHAIDTVLMPR
jgi:uncharacterized surface protein with fasciclin (FAS1) repeats